MNLKEPERLAWTDQFLAELPTPVGAMRLTRSLTSGLARRANDPPNVFWGVGDRGPNIKPIEAVRRYGLVALSNFTDIEGAKIMPLPQAGPSIARFRSVNGTVELEEMIALRIPDGTWLPGLPPPALLGMETEPVFGLDGAALGTAPDGADTEGIAACADGRFWIAEEYGPSLLLVKPDGEVVLRIVPKGAGGMFTGSTIPIKERLPAIALSRRLNRGFEALTISFDGSTLYLAFQSPLAHPDRHTHETSDLLRIWALDPGTGDFRAEYAYPLEHPEAFVRDCSVGSVVKSDVKVSELACHPDGSLLVLERVTLSTHIYRITPSQAPALPACFIDPFHRPTLEQISQYGAAAAGIQMLTKELVLSTDNLPQICGDLEGMLILDDGSILLANDSDYGIQDADTQFWRISPSKPWAD